MVGGTRRAVPHVHGRLLGRHRALRLAELADQLGLVVGPVLLDDRRRILRAAAAAIRNLPRQALVERVALEDLLAGRVVLGAEDHTTSEEVLEGDSLDERLAREVPDRGGRRPEDPTAIVEEDGPDDEPELIGELGESESPMSPEEAAMHVRDRAPGATDHPDDYVEE